MKVIRNICPLCNARCLRASHFPKHVARACRRKAEFVSLDDAVAMAGSVTRGYGDQTHVYWCPLGDHWHLTTSERFIPRTAV